MTHSDKIQGLLKKRYPSPETALKFSTPFELLVATILSAQCTDARVNVVTRKLFDKYHDVEDYASVDVKVLEQEIKPTGFYRNKAKNIIASAKMIAGVFGSKVPMTLQELVKLPGVARKTANVVLFGAFGKNEGIAVDTHVARVSYRLGLTKSHDPVKIEADLMKFVDKGQWGKFSLRLIWHGRQVCKARNPDCRQCVLGGICPSRLDR
ncbi:MAG: endonuclease III [Candidatus Omnitrophota bacterium]